MNKTTATIIACVVCFFIIAVYVFLKVVFEISGIIPSIILVALISIAWGGIRRMAETDEKTNVSESENTEDVSNPFAFVISKTQEAMSKDAEQYLEQGDEENDPDKSIAAYEMAIKLKPDLVEAYINMGLKYAEKKNDFRKALECYEKALSIKPDSGDAYFNMGSVYAQRKDFDMAIGCYENAIKYNKYDFKAYEFMSCCYRDKGDEAKQIECVKTAAELGDRKAQSWLLDKGFLKVGFN